MNKIFSTALLLGLAVGLTSCVNEEDDKFSGSPAERIEEAMAKGAAALAAPANGWAMEYYPTNNEDGFKAKSYILMAKFNASGEVTVGMNNEFSYNEYKEGTSTWDVIGDNGPVLTFNTYNPCIHVFSEPEDLPTSVTGSKDNEQGLGAEGDYEFVIVDTPEDHSQVMLKGKKRSTYVRLTPLDDGISFSDYLDKVNTFRDEILTKDAPNPLMITVGDTKYEMYNVNTRLPNVIPFGGDSILERHIRPYGITYRGGKYYMRFREAIQPTDDLSVQEFVYNEETTSFTGVEIPEATIAAYPADLFFAKELEGIHSWNMTRFSDKCQALADGIEALYQQMFTSPKKYRMTDITFMKYEDTMVARLKYGSSAYYKFDIKNENNTITLTYAGAYNDGSAKLAADFSEIEKYLTSLNGTYTLKGAETNINLLNVTLTSTEDAGKWFNLKWTK